MFVMYVYACVYFCLNSVVCASYFMFFFAFVLLSSASAAGAPRMSLLELESAMLKPSVKLPPGL